MLEPLVYQYTLIGALWALFIAANVVSIPYGLKNDITLTIWSLWILVNGTYLGFVIGLTRSLGG